MTLLQLLLVFFIGFIAGWLLKPDWKGPVDKNPNNTTLNGLHEEEPMET